MVRLAGFILLIVVTTVIQGQPPDYNYYYRVYFNDKGDISPGDYIPSQLLSEKALIRREKEAAVARWPGRLVRLVVASSRISSGRLSPSQGAGAAALFSDQS